MKKFFKKGDIILVKFPYSDLSQVKIRPALVIATIDGENLIVSQITTNCDREKYSIKINYEKLKFTSYIRLDFIMTLDKSLYLNKIDKLSRGDLLKFNQKLKAFLQI